MIGDPDCYADFFIEGGDPQNAPFHEAFAPPGVFPRRAIAETLVKRMARVDRARFPWRIGPGYKEFFVDSIPDGRWSEGYLDTGPFHENGPWVEGAITDPGARIRMLSQLDVIQAYLRMREQARFKDHKS